MNAGYAPAAESNGGDELPSNTGDDESNAPATVPSEAALDMARHFLGVETKIAANHWDNVATRDSVKTYNPLITPIGRHAEELRSRFLDRRLADRL